MEETYLLKHPGVKKKILHGGQGPLPHFPPGTKLVFHFQTLLDNFERTVIDDSRKNKQPTEIFVGKMFKMEVWEVLLTSMRIGEVAEFWCDAIHTGLYPIVAKGMRLAAQGKDPLEGQKHMCGMGNVFTYHSTGFPELDELMREPQPLIFIMELISVGDRFSYQRESWLMEKDEKMQAVPSLHQEGNALVRLGRYRHAADKYKEAVLLLRIVQSREMPGDEDYIRLGKMMIPLVLNYCQCMLELEEYYEVIEHTTELLEKHKDCVKAYYKRAKAYTAVWSEKEARRDFLMVSNLDVTLSRLVQRELKLLSEKMKEKYWEDRETYWKKLEEKEEAANEEEATEAEHPREQEAGENPGEKQHCPQQEAGEEKDGKTELGHQQEQPKFGAECSLAALMENKNRQQMLRLIMLMQDEGSFHIKERRFSQAMLKYEEALELVDHLQTKEVEYKGEDWESLERVRLPLTLNLSQCKLELGEYQAVVDLNSKLLKNHKDNLKAVYQRARAHAALYNEEKARRDFTRAESLDPKLKPVINQELKKLGDNLRAKLAREKKNYWASSKEKWQQKASKHGRKKEVKWADGGEDVRETSTAKTEVVEDEEETTKTNSANSDQGGENLLGQSGDKGEEKEESNGLDEEQTSSLSLKEGKAEVEDKPADEEGGLAAAHDGADNPERIKGSAGVTLEETDRSGAALENPGDLTSTCVQAERVCSADVEAGSSAGVGDAAGGKSPHREAEKVKAGSGCRSRGKNTGQKPRPKQASATATNAPKTPTKAASQNSKGRPNKK